MAQSRRGIRHPKKRACVAAFAESGNVTLAAESAGVHRTTVYDWLRDDEEFAAAMADAGEQAADRLEEAARLRAVEGVTREKSHYHRGDLVGSDIETVYSDTLLMFLLKGLRPEKYRERGEITHHGTVQHTHEVDLSGLTDDELALLETLAERAAGPGENSPGEGAA